MTRKWIAAAALSVHAQETLVKMDEPKGCELEATQPGYMLIASATKHTGWRKEIGRMARVEVQGDKGCTATGTG